MIRKTTRVLSFAVSAAIMLTNMISPMTAFAEESVGTEAILPESVPEVHYLTLPYYENVSYTFENERIFAPEAKDPADKDVVLSYQEGEEASFSFAVSENVQVTAVHLTDRDRQENSFDLSDDNKVTFSMPDKDLRFDLEMEPVPVAEETAASPETNGDAGETAMQIGETTPVIDTDTQPESSIAVPAAFESEADSSSAQETQGQDSAEPQTAAQTETSPETPGLELTADTESDGLPDQGSIQTVETLSIPLAYADFHPESDFTNITFDQELDKVSLVSSEVDVNVPGNYSTIYKVSRGERMWYVLRPVLVMQENTEKESETAAPADQHSGSESTESGSEEGSRYFGNRDSG